MPSAPFRAVLAAGERGVRVHENASSRRHRRAFQARASFCRSAPGAPGRTAGRLGHAAGRGAPTSWGSAGRATTRPARPAAGAGPRCPSMELQGVEEQAWVVEAEAGWVSDSRTGASGWRRGDEGRRRGGCRRRWWPRPRGGQGGRRHRPVRRWQLRRPGPWTGGRPAQRAGRTAPA